MTLEQIKSKIKYGDYNVLGEMLGISVAASKMRLKRKDENAREAMQKIIEAREMLIEKFNNKN